MRKEFLLAMTLLTAATGSAGNAGPFVKVEGRHFLLEGRPWFVCGANLWYGANLGRPGNPAGRARLRRELDRLQRLGVNNLRVLGASEACAVAGTVKPAIQEAPGVYNEDVLAGLDFLVQEAGRRGMRLVVFLNNYWDWSGGVPQYLSWATGSPAIGLGQLEWHRWNEHQAAFYTNARAQAMYRASVAMLVNRKNTLTGVRYADDPIIMAWELANEPRPGERPGDDEGVFRTFLGWVDGTAAYLHSLDPNHLVTTGSEGYQGGLYNDERVRAVHAVKTIDYLCFHLWPKNWGWFKGDRFAETLGPSLEKSGDYVRRHLAIGDALDKPAVCEEFGLDRDGGPEIGRPTTSRDRFYAAVYGLIEESAATGGAAAGSNFWLWGGEGRPPAPGAPPPADGIGAGDMPQEPPGLNTVRDSDASTLRTIADHFRRLRQISDRPSRSAAPARAP